MYTEWFHIDTINLTNLRELCIVDGEDEFHNDTINLTNLLELCIVEGEDEEEKVYSLWSLANLTCLQRLSLCFGYCNISTLQPLLSCKHLKSVWLNCKIEIVAELSFLPESITDLILTASYFTEDPMPTLGRLPNLAVLVLDQCAFVGEKMVCSAKLFPCLQFLKLGTLLYLEEFQVDDRALPSLRAFQTNDINLRDKILQRVTSLPPKPPFWN